MPFRIPTAEAVGYDIPSLTGLTPTIRTILRSMEQTPSGPCRPEAERHAHRPVPEGRNIVAHRFSGGNAGQVGKSPRGATHSPRTGFLAHHIFRVVFHTMFLQERAKFFLEAEFAVMRLLIANITCNLVEI